MTKRSSVDMRQGGLETGRCLGEGQNKGHPSGLEGLGQVRTD